MTFETLPVVHLERGRFPEYPDAAPEDALTRLARRFGRVVVVDADGVRRNEPDLGFLQTTSRKRALWLDAGSRYADDAMDLYVAGAEAVTLRWNTLDSATELEEAASLCQPGTLHLALEFPKGRFLAHRKDGRSAEEVAALAAANSLGLVLLVDSFDALRAAPTAPMGRYVQGLGRADAMRAQELGFQGALLAPSEVPPEDAE